MLVMDYRDTTRVGGCIHCGHTTVQVCEGCERFVCDNCERAHDLDPFTAPTPNSRPEQPAKPGG
jgi:hypothetical protein